MRIIFACRYLFVRHNKQPDLESEGFFYVSMRNFTLRAVEHWTEIRENGAVVATLFKTFHPTIPFEVFMKNGVNKAKRVSTIGEATDFILENSKQPEK